MLGGQQVAKTIRGIPCQLRTSSMRRAVQIVLDRIDARFPKDLTRLRAVVREIVPFSEEDAERELERAVNVKPRHQVVVRGWFERGEMKKTLAFMPGIASAQELAEAFREQVGYLS